MTSARPKFSLLGGLALAVLACAGSGTSSEPTPVRTLGFLTDYDQLAPGRGTQARLIFIDFTVDFSAYQRVIVEPVVAWNGGADEERLAASFDAALREELGAEFDLVEVMGPGTLRVRCAVAMKDGSLLGVEVEILDAVLGARLAAAVDERPVSRVDHDRARAQQASELARWAGAIRGRLAALRSFDTAQGARGDEQTP